MIYDSGYRTARLCTLAKVKYAGFCCINAQLRKPLWHKPQQVIFRSKTLEFA